MSGNSIMTKVIITKPLQGWQVDDNDKSGNNNKSNNIRSVGFELIHVVWSHDHRSCDHNITIAFFFDMSFNKWLII